MIEKLTLKQENDLIEWHKKWFAIGCSTDPADRSRAEAAISAIYTESGEKTPKYIWVQSPATGIMAIWIIQKANRASLGASLRASLRASLGASLRASLRESLRESLGASLRESLRESLGESLGDYWGGQNEAGWQVFYLFCQHIGARYDEKATRQLNFWAEISQSCGWWWPYRDVCIVSDRPERVCWEPDRERPRLHSEDGPALRFRDGWSLWCWHGLRVPEHIIMEPEKITPATIHEEQNQEIRRAMIERVGWERYTCEAGAKEIHSNETGTLLELPSLGDGDAIARFVRVMDPSTGRQYVLRVPPTVKTAREAVAWTFGVPVDQYRPEMES